MVVVEVVDAVDVVDVVDVDDVLDEDVVGPAVVVVVDGGTQMVLALMYSLSPTPSQPSKHPAGPVTLSKSKSTRPTEDGIEYSVHQQ